MTSGLQLLFFCPSSSWCQRLLPQLLCLSYTAVIRAVQLAPQEPPAACNYECPAWLQPKCCSSYCRVSGLPLLLPAPPTSSSFPTPAPAPGRKGGYSLWPWMCTPLAAQKLESPEVNQKSRTHSTANLQLLIYVKKMLLLPFISVASFPSNSFLVHLTTVLHLIWQSLYSFIFLIRSCLPSLERSLFSVHCFCSCAIKPCWLSSGLVSVFLFLVRISSVPPKWCS